MIRSLGAPDVVASAAPHDDESSTIVVAWELCWYRFEVDLADERRRVRRRGQGYELTELEPRTVRSRTRSPTSTARSRQPERQPPQRAVRLCDRGRSSTIPPR